MNNIKSLHKKMDKIPMDQIDYETMKKVTELYGVVFRSMAKRLGMTNVETKPEEKSK